MSSSYRYSSTSQHSYTHQQLPDLQPVFSALALVVLIALFSHLGLSLLAPRESFRALSEMTSLGVSNLLGKAGLGKVNWAKSDESEGGLGGLVGEGKGKVVRRYKETKDGASRAAGGGQHYPGLLNAAGNLCFLNATLQSMASLPSLLSYLDTLVTSALEFSVPTPVSETLLDTLEALNTPSTSQPAPLRPLELANALAASSPSRRRLLASSEQQDAHELWGMIRDAVEEEAGKLLLAQERQSQVGGGLAEALRMRSGLWMTLSRRKTGRGRNDPWFFLRSQRIRCMTCGYVRDTRHEGEELLMLQVPPVAQCSIYDLLHEFTKTDLLSDYNCQRCAMLATLSRLQSQRDRLALTAATPTPIPTPPSNPFDLPPNPPASSGGKSTSSKKDRKRKIQKLVDKVQVAVDAADFEREIEDVKLERAETAAGKTVKFARTPDILLLHLNRSTYYGYSGAVKNSCHVVFPEYLDISPFCDGSAPSTPSVDSSSPTPTPPRDLYRLSSLVVHYGSANFGHYVAYRRRPTPSNEDPALAANLPMWYRISDETVIPSSLNEALRANPFLLFYERVQGEGGDAAAQAAAGLAGLEAVVNGAQARVVESWRARTSGETQDVDVAAVE